jgi:hypothetical protein
MKHRIQVVTMTAMLLATPALAEEVAPPEVDTRTEAEKREDAQQEAWDNAQLEALRADSASVEPVLLPEEADESTKALPANEYTEAEASEFLRVTQPGAHP